MKFIHYLETIAGIDIYPLISLIIFFVFFTLLLVYVYKADHSYILKLKNIPLDEAEPSSEELSRKGL
jgi:hypothetical protein